jgi:hypothetical protein
MESGIADIRDAVRALGAEPEGQTGRDLAASFPGGVSGQPAFQPRPLSMPHWAKSKAGS